MRLDLLIMVSRFGEHTSNDQSLFLQICTNKALLIYHGIGALLLIFVVDFDCPRKLMFTCALSKTKLFEIFQSIV